MQIVLLERVRNTGNIGDVVRVRDGYARNFLIPKGIAKRATAQALEDVAQRRAELEARASDRLQQAQTQSEKMKDARITLKRRAGHDGKLFGSVTPQDIAEALHAHGFAAVSKAQIDMPHGVLKAIGEYSINVQLHHDVLISVTAVVEGETA